VSKDWGLKPRVQLSGLRVLGFRVHHSNIGALSRYRSL
jgi:hypothetical protein